MLDLIQNLVREVDVALDVLHDLIVVEVSIRLGEQLNYTALVLVDSLVLVDLLM